jgi:DNA polymerase I-like protein with 3'-5' exonuclease and polymerase domains
MLDKVYAKIAGQTKDEYFPGASVARLPEFRSRKADFHSAVAKICVKKEYEVEGKDYTEEELIKGTKEFRPKAKSIGLGVMYGSGNAKVADEMTRKGCPMTTDEAADIRKSIYEGVPFLDALNKMLMTRARDRGYIVTILGRRGHFDTWECPCWDKDQSKELAGDNLNFKSRQEAFEWYNKNVQKYDSLRRPQRAYTYKALNKYIQGSSADQTKTAMLHLYKRNKLELNALDIYYRRIPDFVPPNFKTQVHDEINVSKTKEESAQWYQEVMENCIPLEVEVVADPVVCTKWSEAK